MRTEALAQLSRYRALEMVHKAQVSHIASSLSCIDILTVAFSRMKDGLAGSSTRRVVLVSKGHAAAGTYAVLNVLGMLPNDQIEGYCQDGGQLGGHVSAGPYVELSTGSLGHALPYAVGRALGLKRLGDPSQVIVLLSDGECDEGSNWEAALVAAHHKLDNIKVLIDRNGLQSLMGTEETLALEPLSAKWSAFNWSASQIDGHDHEAITTFLDSHEIGPAVAIAKTTKGAGVSFMENKVEWHYRAPSDDQLAQAKREIFGHAQSPS